MMKKKLQQLIDKIESEYLFTSSMTGKKKLAPNVKAALLATPREKFVPPNYINRAYYNMPLPIGYGQTISQPYIVAIMTDLLELDRNHIVLEIGTGSGYQAAILSQLCKKVYTIENVAELAKKAKNRFDKLAYNNIECKTGNGYYGWPEHAPYDAIIATAAASQIPGPLIRQLKPGGRMVIPIGKPYLNQELLLLKKDEHNQIDSRVILDVAFVPFVGARDD